MNQRTLQQTGIATLILGLLLSVAMTMIAVQTAQAEGSSEGTPPVAHWELDETTGATAADTSVSGMNLTGVNISDANWITNTFPCEALPSGAIELNGTDEYLSTDSESDVLRPESVAMSAWVRFDDVSEGYSAIAGNYLIGEGNFGYGLYADFDAGVLGFGAGNSNAELSSFPFSDDGSWVFIVGVFAEGDDGVGIIAFDQEGEIIDTAGNDAGEAISYRYLNDFAVGASVSGSYSADLLTGAIDDLRVYDRVIEFEEIGGIATGVCLEEDEEPAVVEDTDGVDNEIEKAAPNNGDANNDGKKDSEQATVASLVSPVSNKYVVLEVPDTCASADSVLSERETAVETKDDDNFDYPAGLLDFTVSGCSVGGDVVITQHYYGDYNLENLVVRKYDKATDTYTTIEEATMTAVTVGGENAVRVVYTVTDGGELDADGEANGVIVDPVGLGEAVLGAPDTGFEQISFFTPLALLAGGLGMTLLAAKTLIKRSI